MVASLNYACLMLDASLVRRLMLDAGRWSMAHFFLPKAILRLFQSLLGESIPGYELLSESGTQKTEDPRRRLFKVFLRIII